MRCLLGAMLLALAAGSGCKWLEPSAHTPVVVPTLKVAAPRFVKAEDINAKNAHEHARALHDELQRDADGELLP